MNEISPCKGCEFRSFLCHSKCRDYQEWKKQHDDINQMRILENQKEQYARPMVLRRRY